MGRNNPARTINNHTRRNRLLSTTSTSFIETSLENMIHFGTTTTKRGEATRQGLAGVRALMQTKLDMAFTTLPKKRAKQSSEYEGGKVRWVQINLVVRARVHTARARGGGVRERILY